VLAEADGNRTRQAEILGFTGFEDREGHQAPVRLLEPLTCVHVRASAQGGRFEQPV
jgi:hypothetical protein